MDRLLRMFAGTFLALMIVMLGIAPLAVPQYTFADIDGTNAYAAPPPPRCPSPDIDWCWLADDGSAFLCSLEWCKKGTTTCGCNWDDKADTCRCRQ